MKLKLSDINIDTLLLEKLDFLGLKILIDWAKDEGWNPGEYDADVFWAADPDGFYGYFYQKKLIAGGAIVSYNRKFGFMGLFIVHSDFRGLGIGTKLWHQRLEKLKSRLLPNASIGMDGVVALQPFYQKGGFKFAFKDKRYEKLGQKFPTHPNISPIQTKDFDKIATYDFRCFGFSRQNFLKKWIFLTESISFQFSENNSLRGFCVLRKVDSGYKIGPLFADDCETAESLYKACLNVVPNKPVFLDIPLINMDAQKLVEKHNAKFVFECGRMYHGKAPENPWNKIFGITTFELG